MPIINVPTDDGPLPHKTTPDGALCTACGFATSYMTAFIQHMWLKHKRRYNSTTKFWEIVNG